MVGALRKSVRMMNDFRGSMTILMTALLTEVSFLVNGNVASDFL